MTLYHLALPLLTRLPTRLARRLEHRIRGKLQEWTLRKALEELEGVER